MTCDNDPHRRARRSDANRRKAREVRAKVAAAEKELLATLTPQERQIRQADQDYALRSPVSSEDRKVRYDDDE